MSPVNHFLMPQAELISKSLASINQHCAQINVRVLKKCSSTNEYLMNTMFANNSANIQLLVAHYQTQGRGRRGRLWLNELGQGLIFSLAIRLDTKLFPNLPTPLPSWLALLAGLGVAQSLTALCFTEIQVKWPNDICSRQRKLAGVLIEQKKDRIVIGVGINALPLKSSLINIQVNGDKKTPLIPTSLSEIWSSSSSASCPPPSSEYIIASVVAQWLAMLDYINRKVAPKILWQHWGDFDALSGCLLDIKISPQQIIKKATYQGIDDFGALIILNNGKKEVLKSAQIIQVYF